MFEEEIYIHSCTNNIVRGRNIYPQKFSLFCKVAPFVNYTIKGVIWYQGENNVRGADNGNILEGSGNLISYIFAIINSHIAEDIHACLM